MLPCLRSYLSHRCPDFETLKDDEELGLSEVDVSADPTAWAIKLREQKCGDAASAAKDAALTSVLVFVRNI